jgi:presenilin-like A22 family membrane protease
MDQRRRAVVASGAIVLIFLVVQLGALAVVEPFTAAGLQPDVDHQDPTNSLLYIGAILVATVFMLAALRFGLQGLIRALVVLTGAYIAVYVLRIVLPPLVVFEGFHVLAWTAGALLGVALYAYPEWYVIDLAGILMGIGAAGLFGITFGVLPALVLLAVLAVYDAISVYGTEHMLTLASGVMEMRVPIVLVVPLSLSYSFLEADLPDPTDEGEAEEPESVEDADQAGAPEHSSGTGDASEDEQPGVLDREALFIGLGDAVIPTVLVASVAFFAPASVPSLDVPGLALTVPAATAMVGTLAGLVVLLWMVLRGRAHAGLPLLNGGAILGYLVGALASGMTLVEALGLSTLF